MPDVQLKPIGCRRMGNTKEIVQHDARRTLAVAELPQGCGIHLRASLLIYAGIFGKFLASALLASVLLLLAPACKTLLHTL